MSQRKIIGLGTNYEQAVVLNGSTQYLSSSSSDFDVTDAVTIGLWIKLTSAGQSFATIMGNSSYKLELTSSGNTVDFAIAGEFATTASVPDLLRDLAWHHVVATYDKVNCRIYIDGRLIVTEAHTNSIASGSGSFTLGAKSDHSGKVNCQIKYAFMCNAALTAAQVFDVYAFGPIDLGLANFLSAFSLKGLWSLNNVYTDLSARGNTLTATGTPTFSNVSGTNFGRGPRTAA